MFTDFDVDFVFRPADGGLAIDGDPYWMAVSGGGRMERRFDDAATTLAANPSVFGNAQRLARHAAFFRYLKADCPEQWRSLQASIAEGRGQLELYAIPIRRMPYTVRDSS